MKKISNGNFHKGFYENSKENSKSQFRKIINEDLTKELEDMDCIYYNAEIFLHGICHIFAYALQQRFGYDILEIKSKSGTTVHWCCSSIYDQKVAYIDVRGITTDYDEFLLEFQPLIGENPSKNKIVDSMDYEDEWEPAGLKFANKIITKYYEYYSLY